MKKIFVFFVTLCCFLFPLSACAGQQQRQQTLTVADVEIYVGDPAAELEIEFGDPDRAEPISYDYDYTYITIHNGKVSAKKEGEVTVKATATSCETTFTVTCLPAKEMIRVDDMYAWVGYPASDISCVLSDELKGTEVYYEYDESKVSIKDGYLTALTECETSVRAVAGDYSTEFIVTCKNVDREGNLYYISSEQRWTEAAEQFRKRWDASGTNGHTTIFIGDSFFDCRYFWTDFYEYYGMYDALCFGIGGTTSHTWELFNDTLLKDVQAKNVVINLGNNNVYNDKTDTEKTVEDLERYFTLLHGSMPDAQLYAYSITARNYDDAFDPRRTVKETNSAIAEWCETKDWITFIDMQDVMTADKLKDNIHPKLEHYSYFVDRLAQTNIQIEVK